MSAESEHNASSPGIDLPASILRFTFARSGGPGGQNVNKLSTKATLHVKLVDLLAHLDRDAFIRLKQLAGRHLVQDELRFISQSSRSQLANRNDCIDQLVGLIARARIRPRRRKATKPSKSAKQRRITSKKQRGEVKRLRTERPESH